MRLGFILGEIWTGLRRNLSMAISVILVTMVSVFLLGLGMLAQRQADTMKGYSNRRPEGHDREPAQSDARGRPGLP